MKKVIIALIFCFIAFTNGYSQKKQESIKELFRVMQTDSMVQKMMASMIPVMLNRQMQGQMQDSTSKAHLNEIMTSIMQNVKEIFKSLMDEDMVPLYDKYFTRKEIKYFIRFYKSPSGQKFLKVSPDMQKELMEIMTKKYFPEMEKSIAAKVVEVMMSGKK